MLESPAIEPTATDWLLPSAALGQPFVFADDVTGGPQGEPSAVIAGDSAVGGSAVVARLVANPASAPARRATAQDTALIDRQGYHIGNVGLLARFDSASELTEMLPVAVLPGAPSWVKGVANLHGNVVPVLDLAILLGVAHDPGKTPMLLVLGHGEAAAAVVIDGLPQRRRFKAQDRIELPVAIPALEGYVQAVYLESASAGAARSGRQGDPEVGNAAAEAAAPIWLDFDHLRFLEDLSRQAA